MRNLTIILLLLCAFVSGPVHAQNIILKSGKSIAGVDLRRAGDSIMTTVQAGAGKGEIGYPVDSIARIEFPEPEALKTASASLAEGKAETALSQVEPVTLFYAPFREIPGNWWADAALLKAQALIQLKRDRESDSLIEEVSRSAVDPQAALSARVLVAASLTRQGEHKKAMEIYDEAIKEGTRPETLARAWLNKGRDYLEQQEYEPALLAFLHVPVLYPEQHLFVPAALGGSVSAYAGLEDWDRAAVAAKELEKLHPSSAAAAEAKLQLQKIEKKQNPPPQNP